VARVGVHIADVSHYVPWGSSIDLDARRRATSVYLVDRVIPMLPERLSNDLCSLRPDEDRRCMTIDLFIDARGRVVSSDAYPALMRSRVRLTYDQAQTLIDGTRESAVGFSGVPGDTLDRLRVCIPALSRIAQQRAALRTERGGLDFDTVEARVVLDDEGCPIDVSLRRKTAATQMVEESMIMANEAAARLLSGHAFPGMYRVHEKPSADDLEGLLPIFQEFPWFDASLEAPVLAGDPFALARVLELSRGRPEHELIVALVLRSMKRAVYSPACDGHFGLASEAYAHFTSPIRRYPDLVVHRMVKALLFGRGERFDQEVSNIPWLAEHSSRMERTAERASRDSQEVKLVELMESQVGKRFSALIAGVATYGLFVRLPNTAEGLVPIDSLGREYFALDPVRHVLTGQDTAVRYRLGQRVDVVLTVADRQTRKLTFKLAPVEQDRPKGRKKLRQRDIDRALRHQRGLDRG
ncbi:MAG: VacB/RNase II family 3'-5' exoribonuclease, partial [Berryella intestinalis]|uniref:ribonuclease R family protein n=1 Tax=Berryella intestinalis TaxID=1531429 RepID=UPI002A74F6E2